MNKVIIIGAGASGMMAAITARRKGAEVILIEHNDQIGKKILSTGNGRCNFTNINQEPMFYHSDEPEFPWGIIEQFSALDTIKFFRELGIYSKNRSGYMYPYSDQASAVSDILKMEIGKLNIPVQLGEDVIDIQLEEDTLLVKTSRQTYRGQKVIVAAGSKASAIAGSDGSGYSLAQKLGHHLVPVVPALVQLRCREKIYRRLAGVRLQGEVSLYVNDQLAARDTGEIQLTDYGISGIPVFQVSRWAARGLGENQKVHAVLDFMPDFSVDEFRQFLKNRAAVMPEKTIAEYLVGLLHKKMIDVLISLCEINQSRKAGDLGGEEIEILLDRIKNFKTIIKQTNSFEKAQICSGGVAVGELNNRTLESKIVPGLYFAGEIVDVDGICGGYNLQWAWSSGFVTGREAAK